MNASLLCPSGYYWNNCWNYCVPCVSGWDPIYCACIEDNISSLALGTGRSQSYTSQVEIINNTTGLSIIQQISGNQTAAGNRSIIYINPPIVSTGVSLASGQSSVSGIKVNGILIPQNLTFLNGLNQPSSSESIFLNNYYLASGIYPSTLNQTVVNSSSNPSPNYVISLDNYDIITGIYLLKNTTPPDINNNVTNFYNIVMNFNTGKVVPAEYISGLSGIFINLNIVESGSDFYRPTIATQSLSFYTQLYSIPTNTYLYSGRKMQSYDIYNNIYYSNNDVYNTISLNGTQVPIATIYANCWGGIDSDQVAPFVLKNSRYSGGNIQYFLNTNTYATIKPNKIGNANDLGLSNSFIINNNSNADGLKLNNGTNQFVYTKSGYFIPGNNSFEITSSAYNTLTGYAYTGYFPFSVSGVLPISAYYSSEVSGVLQILPNASCPPLTLYSGASDSFGSNMVTYKNPLSLTPGTEVFSVGSSLYFNGDGFVQIADSAQFDLSASAYTIEGWFYATELNGMGGASNTFISKDDYNGNLSWCIQLYNDGVYIATNNGSSNFNCITTISTNNWHHIALCSDGYSQYVYLDGILIGSAGFVTTNSQSNITLGCSTWNNPSGFFNGYISNVRITNGVRVYNGDNTSFANFSIPNSPLGYVQDSSSNISQIIGNQVALLLNTELNSSLVDSSTYSNSTIVAQGEISASASTPFTITNYFNGASANINLYKELTYSSLNIVIGNNHTPPETSSYRVVSDYPASNNLGASAGISSNYINIPQADSNGYLPFGTNYFSVEYSSKHYGSGSYPLLIQSNSYNTDGGASMFLTVNVLTPDSHDIENPISISIPSIPLPPPPIPPVAAPDPEFIVTP